ncbi:MAG: NAD-dependent epimerase/dehydratase family protein [Thermoplasmatales archaeon]|jgi:UDP-glucose 4-epimerase|nr:NAD-dependent epimerase/dehydratase family protein [Candidatus Thermoplasmatota archaeon]MCL6002400.1 NAD-dependent epimerase/dehydratase family protein [Candidatus Thermoplasmatota archaeon]MDA8055889.1 NAD-dependent epimerase/dehydratase family protein [Thermoplasmatales archaeon]
MDRLTGRTQMEKERDINILVTGGAGVIGSSLVKKLSGQITVTDNLSSSSSDPIADLIASNKVKFVRGDVRNLRLMKELTKDIDLVVHLAANGDVRYSPEKGTKLDTMVNTVGTFNVLEAMRVNDVKKIIFSSSSSVYGRASQIPTPETYGPLIPESLYASSKIGAEALILSFSKMFSFKAYIFRFANIVSSNFRKVGRNVIPDFVMKLKDNPKTLEVLGNGHQKKSYLYVDDCINGMLYASAKSRRDIDIFNLANIDSIEVKEIAKIVIEEMGLVNTRIKYTGGEAGWLGDVPISILDIKKVTELGWTPKLNSMEAVRKSARGIIRSISIRRS